MSMNLWKIEQLCKENFALGAASRDAEVAEYTLERTIRKATEQSNIKLIAERDQLREQVKMLRNELNMIYKLVPDLVVFQMEPSALAATEPR